MLEGAICGLENGSSCTPSFSLFYSYPFYLFVISLPPLSLPAAYYLVFLLSASRIIVGTQVWRLQREIQRSTCPTLFLVILSYNILFLSFITASYFYTVLFFQLVYCLSLFTSRPHWRHLLLNAQQLKECLAYNMYLRKCCGWVGRGISGWTNNEWLGKTLTWDSDNWV